MQHSYEVKSAHGYRRSMHFKDFSIVSSGSHFIYQSGTILAVLVGSYLGNIPVKFELHKPNGSEGDSI